MLIVDSTLSNNEGGYLFDNIPAGTYQISSTVPKEFAPVLDFGLVNEGLDSDFESFDVFASTGEFLLSSGQTKSDIDLGFAMIPANIEGLVWEDFSFDGQRDSGENLLEGIRVRLLDNNFNTIDSTLTDASGKYRFEDLFPGNYIVEFSGLDNYTFTKANIGSDITDSDVTSILVGVGRTDLVELNAGADQLAIDAGLIKYSSIGDFVWDDVNVNGVQDAGEPGIADITIYFRDMSGVVDEVLTDSMGKYTIDSNGVRLK